MRAQGCDFDQEKRLMRVRFDYVRAIIGTGYDKVPRCVAPAFTIFDPSKRLSQISVAVSIWACFESLNNSLVSLEAAFSIDDVGSRPSRRFYCHTPFRGMRR